MAFPTTGVLDNFNRADGGPGGNWTTGVYTDPDAMAIASNTISFPGPTESGGYWNPATFGGDCEVTLDLPTVASGFAVLFARISSPGSSCNGYRAQFRMSFNDVRMHRLDAGVLTQIGSTTAVTYTSGDSIGFELSGSAIAVYQKTGGVWAQITSTSDATYGAAGNIGMNSASSLWRGDNFGGGTISTAATTPPLPVVVDTAVGRAASW